MVIENITYFLFIFSILVIGRSLLRLISFLLQNVNDYLFSIIFIYFRCYVFLKDIIFNKSFYDRLLSSGNFTNKLFICGIFVFLILNIYWSFIICKSGCKKTINIIQEKIQTDYVDDEIILIEKIKDEIINRRLNEKC